MADNDVVIFGRNGCPYTEDALRLIKQQGRYFTYIEVDSVTPESLGEIFGPIAKDFDHTTVPCIFEVKFVGGFSEYAKK